MRNYNETPAPQRKKFAPLAYEGGGAYGIGRERPISTLYQRVWCEVGRRGDRQLATGRVERRPPRLFTRRGLRSWRGSARCRAARTAASSPPIHDPEVP